ncbi:immunoglobulin domain-containing protein [Microbacterium sp. Ru50]|nr:immunoglobulin domain-containing protein [Microbacterium sp. Ru50]
MNGSTSRVTLSYDLPDVWWHMNGYMYRAKVAAPTGVVIYSDPATLTVLPGQIAVNASPQGQTLAEGATAVFTARHGGASAPAEVRWQESRDQSSWTDIDGSRVPIGFNAEARFEVEADFALDGMSYRAVFSNARTEAATNPARLTVIPALAVVSESPVSRSVSEGGSATFTSRYTGTAAPTSATWEHSVDGGASWADVPDAAADPTLTFERVTLDMDGRQYRVRYSNASGSVWSDAATLTVNPVRPVVTEHPGPAGVPAGSAAEFSAAFGGTDAETTVQWQFSTDGGATFSYVPAGVGPNGAQSIPLIVDTVTPEMDGWLYRVRFTNAAGSVWSDAATLSVASVWPDAAGQAVRGGEVELRIYSSDAPRFGVMEITAPEGTRITSARTNGANLSFLVDDEGRTAVSSRAARPWGGPGPSAWVTLQVDPGTAPGTWAEGGVARIVDDGLLTAVTSIAVEVLGAPEITQHPQAVSVVEGQGAVLSAAATGHPAPTVQWQASADAGASWVDVDGATGVDLAIDDVRLSMGGTLYRAVFSNSVGATVTEAAALTVRPVRPVVTEHPGPAGVPAGSAAEFSAAFGGTDAETTVQWQFSTDGGATFSYVPAGVGPNGAQSIPLIIDTVTPEMDGWLYRVRFTNAAGSAWSDAARLTVAAVWPDVVGQAVAGGEVEVQIYSIDEPRAGVMEVTAPEGTRITSARSNGVNITFLISEDGRTAVSSRLVNPWGGSFPSAWVTLQVDPDAPAGAILDGGQARAMSSAGVPNMVMSIAVEVIAAPEITQHPQAVSIVEGQGAVLSAAATGHPAPTVQWQASADAGASWADIDGATGAEFTIDDARLAMDGTLYRAVFTNSAGTAVTESARLSVREVRYLNLSVRPIVRLVDTL